MSSEYTPLSFPTPLAERKRIQNSLGAGKGQMVFSPSNRLDENKLLWHRKFSHAKTLNMMDVVLGVTLHKFNQIFTWQTVIGTQRRHPSGINCSAAPCPATRQRGPRSSGRMYAWMASNWAGAGLPASASKKT